MKYTPLTVMAMMVAEAELEISQVNILHQYNEVNMDGTCMLGRCKNTRIKEVQTISRKSKEKMEQSIHMHYRDKQIENTRRAPSKTHLNQG
jgi:hypothetical protein